VLAHLQRRRCWSWYWSTWWREREVFRCSLDIRMALGLKYYFDPLWLGSSIHMVCVALWVSFPKCPRSSNLEFGARSWQPKKVWNGAENAGPEVPVSLTGSFGPWPEVPVGLTGSSGVVERGARGFHETLPVHDQKFRSMIGSPHRSLCVCPCVSGFTSGLWPEVPMGPSRSITIRSAWTKRPSLQRSDLVERKFRF